MDTKFLMITFSKILPQPPPAIHIENYKYHFLEKVCHKHLHKYNFFLL